MHLHRISHCFFTNDTYVKTLRLGALSPTFFLKLPWCYVRSPFLRTPSNCYIFDGEICQLRCYLDNLIKKTEKKSYGRLFNGKLDTFQVISN